MGNTSIIKLLVFIFISSLTYAQDTTFFYVNDAKKEYTVHDDGMNYYYRADTIYSTTKGIKNGILWYNNNNNPEWMMLFESNIKFHYQLINNKWVLVSYYVEIKEGDITPYYKGRCKGVTSRLTPCKNKGKYNGFCHWHK